MLFVRLSTPLIPSFKFHRPVSYRTARMSTFAASLADLKQAFLSDAQQSRGHEWTIVMGNEAGDLDSLASAIGLSWILNHRNKGSQPPRAVPLFRVADEHDLALRAENLYALQQAGMEHPAKHLLFLSDLKSLQPYPATSTFALVDHNVLSAEFAPGGDIAKATVSAILDHHKDEDKHKDAEPRIIQSAGSCASLVATFGHSHASELPSELATLLLSAILIDTNGFKAGGKAEDVDHQAAALLVPQARLSVDEVSITSTESQVIKELTKTLKNHKDDVSHLSPRDLLRRDYKEKTYALSWIESHPAIQVGLATVPLRLKDWASHGVLVKEGTAWMKERKLHILGVLTSYTSKKTKQHKREMAWIVLQDEPNQFDHLPRRLWKGLEEDSTIQVTEKKDSKVHHLLGKADLPGTVKVRVYDQGNPTATRKATAPLVEQILTAKASL